MEFDFAKFSSHDVPLTINSLAESWMTLKSSSERHRNLTLDKRNYKLRRELFGERSQMTTQRNFLARSKIDEEFSGELNLRPKFQGFSFKQHLLPRTRDKEEEKHRKQQDSSELAQCTEARREIAFSTRG